MHSVSGVTRGKGKWRTTYISRSRRHWQTKDQWCPAFAHCARAVTVKRKKAARPHKTCSRSCLQEFQGSLTSPAAAGESHAAARTVRLFLCRSIHSLATASIADLDGFGHANCCWMQVRNADQAVRERTSVVLRINTAEMSVT